MNDVAPALQASRSGPRDAAVPEFTGFDMGCGVEYTATVERLDNGDFVVIDVTEHRSDKQPEATNGKDV